MQHVISDFVELNQMRYDCYTSHKTMLSLTHDEVYREVMDEMENLLTRIYRNVYYQLKRTYTKDAEGLANTFIKGILVKPTDAGYHIAIKRLNSILKGSADINYARECLQRFLELTYNGEYMQQHRKHDDKIFTALDYKRNLKDRLDAMTAFQLVLQNVYEIHTDWEPEEIERVLYHQQRILLNEPSTTNKFKRTVDDIRNFLGGLCLK